MIILLLYTHVFHAVSQPLFESGLANPAFTCSRGTYEAHITANENFTFDYLSAGARINSAAISFATYRAHEYRQSWSGINYRFTFPLAVGLNLGTAQIYQQSHFLADIGFWFSYGLHFGFSYRDIFQDERLLRAGASYTIKNVSMMYEIENGGFDQHTDHNLSIGYTHTFNGIKLNTSAGYDLHNLAFTMGLAYKQFQLGVLVNDTLEVDVMVSIFLEPPTREKIVLFQETLEVYVQKPTKVKKQTDKKSESPVPLSASERLACEQHYLKGIEYYIDNKLDEAINEWNHVVKICPTYKDVKRYLDNAHAKKEILKKE